MNTAQQNWKINYRYFKTDTLINPSYWREMMQDLRREAALERKLAAAQRQIEAQAQRISELHATLIVICDEYDSDNAPARQAMRMNALAQAGIKNARQRVAK